MIKLIADSTCDLAQEILDQYDINMAPLTVTIDNKVYKDRIDIQPDDLYTMIEDPTVMPTTAMPSPTEYIRLFEQAVKDGYKQAETVYACVREIATSANDVPVRVTVGGEMDEEHPLGDVLARPWPWLISTRPRGSWTTLARLSERRRFAHRSPVSSGCARSASALTCRLVMRWCGSHK